MIEELKKVVKSIENNFNYIVANIDVDEAGFGEELDEIREDFSRFAEIINDNN